MSKPPTVDSKLIASLEANPDLTAKDLEGYGKKLKEDC